MVFSMKKWIGIAALLGLCLAAFEGKTLSAYAEEPVVVEQGIYAEEINLSGMTLEEVDQVLTDRFHERESKEITLKITEESEVTVTAMDLGITWSNPGLSEEAVMLGKRGNVIERYKIKKDLQRENKVLSVAYDFDQNAILQILRQRCEIYNQDAIEASLTKEDENFVVTEGQTGIAIDEDASAEQVYDYLTQEWDGSDSDIVLVTELVEPKIKTEDLEQVQDLLGSFTTSYSTSSSSRCVNVENGCNLINGTLLYPGEEFSTYATIAPFSTENGYQLAGSYLNGQVVESLGGGICQVSTTLYNAVLLSELEVSERHNHSMIIGYVDPSADAAISESAGKDFRFVNTSEYPIYIEGFTNNKHITFNIYGKEDRPDNREVRYYSEVLERDDPTFDMIYTDAAQPAGWYGNKQAAHVGYKARLWKTVKENGVEISKELVNSSVYKKSPRSVTIGVSTEDPAVYNALMAAVASQNVDYAIAAVQAIQTGGAVPELPAPKVEEAVVDTQADPDQLETVGGIED